ncbi:Hypothetical predicted protein [Olea europaea subsp. europaea]|uniref:Uncharacterized protein n=1 Tax=Olea europaea subsp. europaea TaxID=158383 RepID=A0A8S0RRU3_OLEEU|nr:Hypothetical predicted protein [Olea europaea subsp. europaea]
MSVQRKERSQPRRDRASDCGVRGADGDRKRGASGERLEGRDSGKKLLQRREGAGSDSNRGGIGPAIVGTAEPATIEIEGPAGSAWRGGIEEKIPSSARRLRERSQLRRDGSSDCGVRGASVDRKRGASGERLEGRNRGKNCFSGEKVQRRERSQPRRDGASDCGVHGAGGDRKRGASVERLKGRDRGKNCFSGKKAIAVGAYLMSIQHRERSKPRRDRASDCGVRGASGDRKRGASRERLEGRDRGKNCFSGENVQRRERSQPRRDRANDCGVRGAGSDRKRRASVERLKGRDRGKNCFSGKKGSDRNRGGTGPTIMGSKEPTALESEGPVGSAWRGGIFEKNCFSGEKAEGAIAIADGPGQRLWGPRSRRRSKVRGQRGALGGAG